MWGKKNERLKMGGGKGGEEEATELQRERRRGLLNLDSTRRKRRVKSQGLQDISGLILPRRRLKDCPCRDQSRRHYVRRFGIASDAEAPMDHARLAPSLTELYGKDGGGVQAN